MKRVAILILMAVTLLVVPGCTTARDAPELPVAEETRFLTFGTALTTIPSANGNRLEVRIANPEGDGPFPVLIGVAGGDGWLAFRSGLTEALRKRGIIAVDFSPQGRGQSEGDDVFHGYAHQDDLMRVVEYVSSLPHVDTERIGLLSYSYGLTVATGALARYPDLPVAFLVDWEGPSCPGLDIRRGLAENEPWAREAIERITGRGPLGEDEYATAEVHGGALSDDEYWQERNAARFVADIPCPYLRVQFDVDHVQSTRKAHMTKVINAATRESGQWTRCNDNQPNLVYDEDTLRTAQFHSYDYGESAGYNSIYSRTVDEVLETYIEEMFFERPYLSER